MTEINLSISNKKPNKKLPIKLYDYDGKVYEISSEEPHARRRVMRVSDEVHPNGRLIRGIDLPADYEEQLIKVSDEISLKRFKELMERKKAQDRAQSMWNDIFGNDYI